MEDGMKLGISATGGSMDAQVEPRFGRCPYFLVVDPETMRFEAFHNPGSEATSGAGSQTVMAFQQRGATVVLTGQVGPKAQQALQAAGLQVVTGVSGKVRDAVQAYKEGKLQA
jgi:predicted Fe-Mo cluster-binding NifX family protein